jgi:hypothetical protein
MGGMVMTFADVALIILIIITTANLAFNLILAVPKP